MTAKAKKIVTLTGLLIACIAAIYLFQSEIGLAVFLGLGLAAFIQLLRVALGTGRSKTLKELWGAFKDAFWGM